MSEFLLSVGSASRPRLARPISAHQWPTSARTPLASDLTGDVATPPARAQLRAPSAASPRGGARRPGRPPRSAGGVDRQVLHQLIELDDVGVDLVELLVDSEPKQYGNHPARSADIGKGYRSS